MATQHIDAPLGDTVIVHSVQAVPAPPPIRTPNGYCNVCHKPFDLPNEQLRSGVQRLNRTHVLCCDVRQFFKQVQTYKVLYKKTRNTDVGVHTHTYTARGANKTDVTDKFAWMSDEQLERTFDWPGATTTPHEGT